MIDEAFSSALRQIWSEIYIAKEKALPGFLPSYERRRVDRSPPGREEEEQGRGRRQGFFLAISKKGAPMMMEPLVYFLVTTTTLTSYLAYLRQAMATLRVVYASISILLDMGGARLIRDLGGIISA